MVNEIPSADPALLRTGQYADSTHLNKRSSIYEFRRPTLDLPSWALDLIQLPAGARVLDAGCGPGHYLRRLAEHDVDAVGVDLSAGMAQEATRYAAVAAADVSALPFVNDSFDVVLAMHMLYHVEPPARAIAELRRVLRPGGVLLVVTNGAGHLDGLDRVIRRATGLQSWTRSMMRFSLENGREQLEAAFHCIERHDITGELVVPRAEPVMDYVASLESFLSSQVAVAWPEMLSSVSAEVDREIEDAGAFRSAVHSGAFVCR